MIVVEFGHVVCDSLELVGSVLHHDAKPGIVDHFGIVVLVSEGDDVFAVDLVGFGQKLNAVSLADAFGRQLENRVRSAPDADVDFAAERFFKLFDDVCLAVLIHQHGHCGRIVLEIRSIQHLILAQSRRKETVDQSVRHV